jgi:aldose 1-epimerase
MAESVIRLLYPGGMASHEAFVSPLGASLRAYRVRDADGWRDVIWPYTGAAEKKGGQGDVLVPFPGRVAGGRYTFAGREHQLHNNDKETTGAIHGFLRSADWETVIRPPRSDAAEVTFAASIRPTDFPGYPFDLRVTVSYLLGRSPYSDATGLRCSFTIANAGDGPAPVGIGFHPYFTFGGDVGDVTLTLPAGRVLEFRDLLPTGAVSPVDGTALDFRTPRRVGDTRLNHCFEVTQPGPHEEDVVECVVEAGGGRTIVSMEASVFRYVVAYTGDALPPGIARTAVAVEPMTCATDAFNHPEWGLTVLQPGAVLGGAYTIRPGGQRRA